MFPIIDTALLPRMGHATEAHVSITSLRYGGRFFWNTLYMRGQATAYGHAGKHATMLLLAVYFQHFLFDVSNMNMNVSLRIFSDSKLSFSWH